MSDSGGANNLQLLDTPIPKLGDFDVLVNIKAVSLNFRDALISKVINCIQDPFSLVRWLIISVNRASTHFRYLLSLCLVLMEQAWWLLLVHESQNSRRVTE